MTAPNFEKKTRERVPFLQWAPFLYASALTGQSNPERRADNAFGGSGAAPRARTSQTVVGPSESSGQARRRGSGGSTRIGAGGTRTGSNTGPARTEVSRSGRGVELRDRPAGRIANQHG